MRRPSCGDLKPWSCPGSRWGVRKPAGKQVLHRHTMDVRLHNWRAVFPSDPILRCCFYMPGPCYLFMPHILPKAFTLCDVVTAVAFDVGRARTFSSEAFPVFPFPWATLPSPFLTLPPGLPLSTPHVCHAVTFPQRGHSDLVPQAVTLVWGACMWACALFFALWTQSKPNLNVAPAAGMWSAEIYWQTTTFCQ